MNNINVIAHHSKACWASSNLDLNLLQSDVCKSREYWLKKFTQSLWHLEQGGGELCAQIDFFQLFMYSRAM